MARKHVPLIHSDYLTRFLQTDTLIQQVDYAVEILKLFKFDAVAFRGISGALIAPLIATKLGKSLILVRKRDEKSHSCEIVEGDRAARTYVIVDDFVSTGETVFNIQREIKNVMKKAKCLGTLEVKRLCLNDIMYFQEKNKSLWKLSEADYEYYNKQYEQDRKSESIDF